MRVSVPGLILAVALYCVEFLIFTYFVIGCHTYIAGWHYMLNASREFVDEVIDTREVTPAMEEEFNLALAGGPNVYAANIYREVKKIDPDPLNMGDATHVGGTITSWIVVDDYSTFNTGDRIVVECYPVSTSPFEAISQLLLRIPNDTAKITKVGRVR